MQLPTKMKKKEVINNSGRNWSWNSQVHRLRDGIQTWNASKTARRTGQEEVDKLWNEGTGNERKTLQQWIINIAAGTYD